MAPEFSGLDPVREGLSRDLYDFKTRSRYNVWVARTALRRTFTFSFVFQSDFGVKP